MSDFQTGSEASPAHGVTSFPENPSQNSQNVVKTEPGATSQLYMEFTDDTPPPPQATTLVQISNMTDSFSASHPTTVVKQERVDPRKEWINSDPLNPYYCKLCDYSMDCMDAFQGHCMGAKHIKRAVEVFNIKLPKKEDEDKKKTPPQFHCQVCLVTCNSDTAWNAHLLGQKHRKVLEKQSAEKAQQKAQERNVMNVIGFRGLARGGGGGPIRGGMFGVGHSRKPYDKPVYAVQQPSSSGPIGARDFATYPEPLIGLEYVTEIQVIGQSPRYHCELCDSKFDHNLKFPHLVGSKHRLNVLKEKNPAIAYSIRGDIKKRSELSSKLLEEAHKLEMQEGRQQVKTRVEKSPFNRINNQANTNQGSFIRPLVQPAARGGSQQWQSQRGGRGGGRGKGKQSSQPYNYNQEQLFQRQQQPSFNRGGRGRGRGRGSTGNNQTRSWSQSYSSPEDAPNVPFPSGSYGIGHQMDQGEGERMLPMKAFQPRSPPRSHDTGMRSSPMIDMYYDDFYSGTRDASAYSSSNLEHNDPRPKPSVDHQQRSSQQASGSGGVGLLQGALADIGKLVSSEEDASMALQVSNALTQALLQFRMQNMPQEGAGDSFSGSGNGAPMNTDS